MLGPQEAKEKAETSEHLCKWKREHVGDSHSRHRNVKETLFKAGESFSGIRIWKASHDVRFPGIFTWSTKVQCTEVQLPCS